MEEKDDQGGREEEPMLAGEEDDGGFGWRLGVLAGLRHGLGRECVNKKVGPC